MTSLGKALFARLKAWPIIIFRSITTSKRVYFHAPPSAKISDFSFEIEMVNPDV
ncbi:hypothetical protein O2N63_11195 [Aliiroseovarius sp. KMU-50]|uniref:Uncharacterized protein n=1 Tax=Aliiroseovarius salicola TaxID=3009082 RepID=A0ABT4W2B0_9RHOB|nr:hypothetical protein [Aliiroseovarius sp. KMU-50]MDA5094650.1 hypothetical protein [Aliiroseovarius sp. KMU-50]